MPAIDMPDGWANSIGGQLKELQRVVKDLSVNRTFSPNIFTVGAGGLTVLGPATLTGGVTGPVAATGALSGTSVAVTGAATAASVTATGTGTFATVSTSGVATIGGVLTADAGMSSLDVRNTTVVTGRTAVWIDSSGRMGNSISSVFAKQDFAPADTSAKIEALLSLGLVDFRLIEAVKEQGDAAPVELGAIAEYVATTPLAHTVFPDAEGAPQGINWVEMIPTMIATMQAMHARIVELEGIASR